MNTRKPRIRCLAARVANVVASVAITTAITTSPAHATGLIAGATFPEQIVQEITLVEQYVAQADQLTQQIQMVMNQARNLTSLPMQMWASASAPLQQMVQLVGHAQGLSYAAQNTVAAVQAQYGAPNAVLSNYAASLQQWTGNLNNQIAGVLQQYDLNATNFQTTQSALQEVQEASLSAAGRMQVLQAGNQISGLMLNQLQSLQSDIQAGNQAMLNFIGTQVNTRQHDRNVQQDWLDGNANYTPGG
ncbi:P-type conjugative transfer protein TrbJ [Thiomonas sp. X19]|uniref:P-type conjugative transfer protein TrbJ n=1 Tax=Thiomonas sp. X19 TaxID=1050370 RepID=UPI000B6825EE|nr:P-type conjugative transfer protein TrbJ [Thiomonas sp. X19]SCC93194.1 P-type conjugative transfer protein TrbJ [Thiomonas sp. X19]